MVGEIPKKLEVPGGCSTEELTRLDLFRKLVKSVPKEEPIKPEVKERSKKRSKKR